MNTLVSQNKSATVDSLVRLHLSDISPVGRTLSRDELALVAGGARTSGASKTIDKINTGHPVPDTDAGF